MPNFHHVFYICFPQKFNWCSCNYVIFFCNGLKASGWKLAPPLIYLNDLTPNICITTVDRNALLWILVIQLTFVLYLDGNQADLLQPVANFVYLGGVQSLYQNLGMRLMRAVNSDVADRKNQCNDLKDAKVVHGAQGSSRDWFIILCGFVTTSDPFHITVIYSIVNLKSSPQCCFKKTSSLFLTLEFN